MLVMQVMINGGIDPFAEPVLTKTFWIDLIARVPIHVINNGH